MTVEAGLTERADTEVVEFCRDLIRIDSSQPDQQRARSGEWVAERLTDAGLSPQIFESEPGRASVVARWAGEDSSRPGAADPRPPRRRTGGCRRLAGRPVRRRDPRRLPVGSRRRRHEGHGRDDPHGRRATGPGKGRRPPRDVVLAFRRRRGGRRRVRRALSSSTTTPTCSRAAPRRSARSAASASTSPAGGSMRSRPPRRASRGSSSSRHGRAGHGSMLNDDNAVTALAEASPGVGRHRFPVELHADRRSVPARVVRRARHRVRPGRRRERAREARPARARWSARPSGTPPTRRCSRPATSTTSSRSGRPPTSTAASCPAARSGSPTSWHASSDRTSRSRWCTATSRCETTFDGALVDAMKAAIARGGPRRAAGALLHVRRHRREVVRRGSASAASASRRCGCRPIWTSAACSTASTNGCRSTACSSEHACCRASSRLPDADPRQSRRTRRMRRRSTTCAGRRDRAAAGPAPSGRTQRRR